MQILTGHWIPRQSKAFNLNGKQTVFLAAPGSGGDFGTDFTCSIVRVRHARLQSARRRAATVLSVIPRSHMPQRPQALDPRTRLALGCSALARAGQALSTTSSPEQARKVLLDVAAQLESDRNLGELVPVDEIATQCRQTSESEDAAAVLAACRRLATGLARRASSLAAEVQQKAGASQTKDTAAPGALPQTAAAQTEPVPPATPVDVPQRPESTPLPQESVAAAAAPELPAAAPSSKPQIDPARLAKISIARNGPEREAVGAAIEAGRRFARVQGVTVIDTQTNLMWLSRPLEGMPHKLAAAAILSLDSGGYRDWRLPTAHELEALLAGNGQQALRSLGVLPAMSAPLLRTGEIHSRFLGWKKEVVVVNSGSGESLRRPLSDAGVPTLAVRSIG